MLALIGSSRRRQRYRGLRRFECRDLGGSHCRSVGQSKDRLRIRHQSLYRQADFERKWFMFRSGQRGYLFNGSYMFERGGGDSPVCGSAYDHSIESADMVESSRASNSLIYLDQYIANGEVLVVLGVPVNLSTGVTTNNLSNTYNCVRSKLSAARALATALCWAARPALHIKTWAMNRSAIRPFPRTRSYHLLGLPSRST